MKVEQISTASSKELVAFYNKHCECFGKKQVTKFSDRMTAEIRVKTMIEDIEAEQAELETSSTPSTLSVCLGLAPKPYEEVNMQVRQEHAEEIHRAYEERHEEFVMPEHCPHCGIHLDNGVGLHNDEVNGKKIKHDKFELCCLACGEEFGPSIRAKREVNSTGESRDNMKTSLKLDRRIVALDDKKEYSNAYRMWKENPTWMTSAQQDNLTAKLYKAAKAGEKIVVVINKRSYTLAIMM